MSVAGQVAAPRMSWLWRRRTPFVVLLAVRYLRSTRRDAFASFLSLVATLGIAVGVAALIVVMAALAGLHQLLMAQVLAGTPQVEIRLPDATMEQAQAVAAGLARRDDVDFAGVQVQGQGWLVLDGSARPVRLVGYEGALPPSFPDPIRDSELEGVYLPVDLALRHGLHGDDRVTLVSPRPTLTPLGPQPRRRSLRLAGTYQSYAVESDARIALPLAAARSLLGESGRRIEVTATGGADRALELAPRLAALLGSSVAQTLDDALDATATATAEVRSWRDLNRSLHFVLRLEKALLFVAGGLIVLVASLALVVDLGLLIAAKRSELGVLGTLGATPAQLRRAFLLLGSLLAAAGIGLGFATGTLGAWAADHYQLLAVPGKVMFVEHIPFRLRGEDLLLVLASASALVLGASWAAAGRVARLRPVEALRV